MPYDSVTMVYKSGEKLARGVMSRISTPSWTRTSAVLVILLIAATGIQTGFSPVNTSRALPAHERTLNATTPTKDKPMTPKRSSPPTNQVVPGVVVAGNSIRPDAGCSTATFPPARTGLATSPVPELRKLAEYEQVCGAAVVSKLSIFVQTPTTAAQAAASAAEVAGTLKTFAGAGVAPLVFMEPTDPDGKAINLNSLAAGSFDSVLDAYFAALQAAGVTSAAMGTWVMMPEGNLPVWTTTDPAIYTQDVIRTASAMKRQFPQSRSALMLDSKSYRPGETWGQGRYSSLLPYVQNIPKGLIDSFGIQGFPWTAQANQPPSTAYDPNTFLRGDLAVEAARSLGISSIWFNTGTFSRMYTNQPAATVTVAASVRQTMLRGIVQQAGNVRQQGFTVAIHLFSENKSGTGEATDWSYWSGPTHVPNDSAVFSTFTTDAARTGLGIWLYDTAR
jgi:hypothetical protein